MPPIASYDRRCDTDRVGDRFRIKLPINGREDDAGESDRDDPDLCECNNIDQHEPSILVSDTAPAAVKHKLAVEDVCQGHPNEIG